MVIHDVVKIGETIVLHPSQTLKVGKDLGNSNYHDLHNIVDNYGNVVKKEKPTIVQHLLPIINKIKKIVQVPHKDENQLHIKHIIETTLPKKVTTLPKIETTLPPIHTTLPKIHTTLPKIHTTLPPIHTTLPKIHTTLPKVETTLPKVETTLPKVETTLPNIVTTLPKVETTLPKIKPTIEPLHISSYTEPSPISIPLIGLGFLCLASILSR